MSSGDPHLGHAPMHVSCWSDRSQQSEVYSDVVLERFRRCFGGRFHVGHGALMWSVCVFPSVFVQGGT